MRNGDADVMIAGGCEAPLTPLSFAGFCNLMAMNFNYNDNPTKASRPFDLNRGGFVMGEGAGVLVLETLSHAVKRGARVYCELAGYGASCDAYHITSPDPEGDGLKRALLYALKDAGGLRPEQVDYVNAHGTSTKKNDQFETIAFKHVFGEHATSNKLMISSIKGKSCIDVNHIHDIEQHWKHPASQLNVSIDIAKKIENAHTASVEGVKA